MPTDYWDIELIVSSAGARLLLTANAALVLAMGALAFVAILATAVVLIRLRHPGGEAGPACRSCGYSLRGGTSTSCPECGATLADGGVKQIDGRPRPRPPTLALTWAMGIVTPMLLLSSLVAEYFAPRVQTADRPTNWWGYVFPWWCVALAVIATAAIWWLGWLAMCRLVYGTKVDR